jgi:GNAT superfamily N-acetyltransferase
VLFRQAAAAELDELAAFVARSAFGEGTASQFERRLNSGHLRPEWIWLAADDGRTLACALWWGLPGGDHPLALDCLAAPPIGAAPAQGGTSPGQVATALLRAAHQEFRAHGMPELPAYHLILPPGWRDNPTVSAEAAWRREAAAQAGLSSELERLRYEWTPAAGVPDQPPRLEFRAEPDNNVFLDAFRRVAVGSLDATTAAGVLARGADRQARDELAIYLAMPGNRDWWRLAYTRDGQLAGLAIPSMNDSGPVVGYLGVVPELRGHGFAGELLAEITRILASNGAERIRADTDVGNRPMAAAFEKAGYLNFAIRLVLSAPPEGA